MSAGGRRLPGSDSGAAKIRQFGVVPLNVGPRPCQLCGENRWCRAHVVTTSRGASVFLFRGIPNILHVPVSCRSCVPDEGGCADLRRSRTARQGVRSDTYAPGCTRSTRRGVARTRAVFGLSTRVPPRRRYWVRHRRPAPTRPRRADTARRRSARPSRASPASPSVAHGMLAQPPAEVTSTASSSVATSLVRDTRRSRDCSGAAPGPLRGCPAAVRPGRPRAPAPCRRECGGPASPYRPPGRAGRSRSVRGRPSLPVDGPAPEGGVGAVVDLDAMPAAFRASPISRTLARTACRP